MLYKVWLQEWLAYYVKPSTKERTYEKYRMQVNRHILPFLGDCEILELTALVLQKFTVSLSDKGLAPSTVNGVISLLKHSLHFAVSLNIVEKQYSDSIIRPKSHGKKVDCFSKEEQHKIEKYVIETEDQKLFGVVLCLYTGLRIGELLALTWEDVDLSKGILSVTKSCHDGWAGGEYVKIIDTPKTEYSSRVIPLPKQLLPHLKRMKKKANEDYVVSGRNRHGAQIRLYQKSFERLLKKLEIDHKGFHSLRHTFATRALECGMDVKTLSEILGHSDPTITLHRYAHSLMDHKKEMMNKLGKLLQ